QLRLGRERPAGRGDLPGAEAPRRLRPPDALPRLPDRPPRQRGDRRGDRPLPGAPPGDRLTAILGGAARPTRPLPREGRARRAAGIVAARRQAMISWTTRPWTSVRRKSRPA